MNIAEGKAVWIFFENITEYLFSILSKKIKNHAEILEDLDCKLKFEFGISVVDLIKNDACEIQSSLDKIEVYVLDKIIESTYFSLKSKTKSKLIDELQLIKNLDLKLLKLIQIADNKSKKISLTRNNIKNSLQHSLKTK